MLTKRIDQSLLFVFVLTVSFVTYQNNIYDSRRKNRGVLKEFRYKNGNGATRKVVKWQGKPQRKRSRKKFLL